jgi:hypothetical protein
MRRARPSQLALCDGDVEGAHEVGDGVVDGEVAGAGADQDARQRPRPDQAFGRPHHVADEHLLLGQPERARAPQAEHGRGPWASAVLGRRDEEDVTERAGEGTPGRGRVQHPTTLLLLAAQGDVERQLRRRRVDVLVVADDDEVGPTLADAAPRHLDRDPSLVARARDHREDVIEQGQAAPASVGVGHRLADLTVEVVIVDPRRFHRSPRRRGPLARGQSLRRSGEKQLRHRRQDVLVLGQAAMLG